MNTDGHRLAKILTGAIGLCCGASLGTGPPEYEVTAIIEGFQCADHLAAVTPFALNEAGDVVGYVTCSLVQRAFRWTAETGFELLEMPPGTSQSRAIDINSHPEGQIVGTADITGLGTRAFLIDGEKLIIIPPPNRGTFSSVAALNNQRQVVGNTADGTPYSKGYIWEEGVMTIIEPTFGPRSAARDINEAGMVVGWMGTNSSDAHAFLWESGIVTDLGPIPRGATSEASATNDVGQIVGRGKIEGDDVTLIRAFLWENDRFRDLGTLPGFDRCAAIDIDNSTTIIGECDQSDNPKNDELFVWRQGVMANLNDLVPDNSDLNFTAIAAINNSGQILTQAASQELNSTVAVILTPIGCPLGDLNGDCAVGATDLLILLASWGPCDNCVVCPADFDADCDVGAADLLILLSNWG